MHWAESDMKSITIRGIDSDLASVIKQKAASNAQSVNQWLLQSLRQITGQAKEPIFKKYHDLDALAGGWSRSETEAFLSNTKLFEKIDEEIWR
jgi:hypothetical protein